MEFEPSICSACNFTSIYAIAKSWVIKLKEYVGLFQINEFIPTTLGVSYLHFLNGELCKGKGFFLIFVTFSI